MHEADDPHSDPADDPTPTSDEQDGGQEGKKRLESALRDIVRKVAERGIVAGLETFARTDKAIRGVVDDVKLPRDLAGYVLSQLDETRSFVVRAVAREVRDFLQDTDLGSELQRLLTSLSFEIRTEVRFIPNDRGGIRPSVRSVVAVPKTGVAAKPVPEDEEDGEPEKT